MVQTRRPNSHYLFPIGYAEEYGPSLKKPYPQFQPSRQSFQRPSKDTVQARQNCVSGLKVAVRNTMSYTILRSYGTNRNALYGSPFLPFFIRFFKPNIVIIDDALQVKTRQKVPDAISEARFVIASDLRNMIYDQSHTRIVDLKTAFQPLKL